MAYTPTLSDESSAILRRISWSVGKPMTKTINAIIAKLPDYMDKQLICECCKDPSKCDNCAFAKRKHFLKSNNNPILTPDQGGELPSKHPITFPTESDNPD